MRPKIKELAKVSLVEVLDATEDLSATVVAESVHWRREYYLPLRHGELRQRLVADERLTAEEQRLFLRMCKILAATFHYEYHERVEELKGEYEPFDPDATQDLRRAPLPPEQEQVRNIERLFEKLTDLLRRANYHKLTQSQIEQAVSAASDWGVRLDVDFGLFDKLEVYARGDVIGRRKRHRWQTLFRPEEIDLPIYQRVVVIFQMKKGRKLDRNLEANAVYIKLFKNIPKEDVDMMLPGAKAKFSLIDSGKIFLPTIALTVWKVITGVLIFTVAGLAGVITLSIFFVSNGLRSLFGYWNTRNKYQLNLTRSLYFQNLDNSSGVLLRLTDEAEEQEFHEAVLAYFLLWREAGEAGWTEAELDRSAESYLHRICGYGVDFDIDDALRKLRRLGLAEIVGGVRWRAVGLQEALVALDASWDRIFDHRPGTL